MENDHINQHYAKLLGLGDEWKVTKVDLNVLGRKLDIFLEYAAEAAICPVCGKLGDVYDQQPERVWRHLDTMQFETLIHAKTPRVKCADHKVKVIELPWASKSSHFTLLFEAFAIDVLKAARSIKDARQLLRLSWWQTQEIMKTAVERGLARREGEEITFVGLDEKSFLKGMKSDAFACIMTDIDNRRVLDVARGRTGKGAETLINKALDPFQQYMVCGVAMDMSAPFEKAVHKLLPCADVVFDKYHIEAHLSEGVDNTRKNENRVLVAKNDKRLVDSKYLWLKGFEHMSDEAIAHRNDLLKCALDTGKAWSLKELFGWNALGSAGSDGVAAPSEYKHLYATITLGFVGQDDVIVLPKVLLNSKAVIASMKTDVSRANITGTCYNAYVSGKKTDMAILKGKKSSIETDIKTLVKANASS